MLFGIAIFYARPAYRGTTQVTQPDGSTVTIRLIGDEYLHYNATADGYSLVRRDDGAYVYAQLNAEGELEPTSLLAHDAHERTAEERNYIGKVGRLIPKATWGASAFSKYDLSRNGKFPMYLVELLNL